MPDREHRFSQAKWQFAFVAAMAGMTVSACSDPLLSPAGPFDSSQRIDVAAAMSPDIIGITEDEVVVRFGEPAHSETRTATGKFTYWYRTNRQSGSLKVTFLANRVAAVEISY